MVRAPDHAAMHASAAFLEPFLNCMQEVEIPRPHDASSHSLRRHAGQERTSRRQYSLHVKRCTGDRSARAIAGPAYVGLPEKSKKTRVADPLPRQGRSAAGEGVRAVLPPTFPLQP